MCGEMGVMFNQGITPSYASSFTSYLSPTTCVYLVGAPDLNVYRRVVNVCAYQTRESRVST